MIGIGYDSYNNYYESNYSNKVEVMAKGKIKIDGTIVFADILGGATGALWGSAVAGPIGAVLMGINGAIIDSGMGLALANSIGKWGFYL